MDLEVDFFTVQEDHCSCLLSNHRMEKEQRVFLAYRAAFEGSNALIRQQKAIQRLVSKHRESAKTLLQSLGEKQVIETLKTLLERKVFQSELEAKLAFPELFAISPSQNVQHIASEADAARSEAEALDDVLSLGGDGDVALDEIADGATPVLTAAGKSASVSLNIYWRTTQMLLHDHLLITSQYCPCILSTSHTRFSISF